MSAKTRIVALPTVIFNLGPEEIMQLIVVFVATLVFAITIGMFAQSGRLRHLNPPTLSTPTGYTHVVAPQRGRLVFIAGQVAADRSGAIVGKGDFKAQTRQVFENLKAAVEAAGGTMADIAKINVYVTDLSQIAAMREIRQQFFTGNPPASTLVQVVSLARPEYLIEIEAILVVE
jgi:2-iminobutanoate/2-iminopropanoate deaminase